MWVECVSVSTVRHGIGYIMDTSLIHTLPKITRFASQFYYFYYYDLIYNDKKHIFISKNFIYNLKSTRYKSIYWLSFNVVSMLLLVFDATHSQGNSFVIKVKVIENEV